MLLIEIEDFIHRHKMTPHAFGAESMDDPKVVSRLRRGATVTLVTADRARSYMKAKDTRFIQERYPEEEEKPEQPAKKPDNGVVNGNGEHA